MAPTRRLACNLLSALSLCAGAAAAQPTGDWVVLSRNDLGMHGMNRNHLNLSVLPPDNNMWARLIGRGNAMTAPPVVTAGVTLECSVPGNTYSVGETDFWTWDQHLSGADRPPNVGLTGKGPTGCSTSLPAISLPRASPSRRSPTPHRPWRTRSGGRLSARATAAASSCRGPIRSSRFRWR